MPKYSFVAGKAKDENRDVIREFYEANPSEFLRNIRTGFHLDQWDEFLTLKRNRKLIGVLKLDYADYFLDPSGNKVKNEATIIGGLRIVDGDPYLSMQFTCIGLLFAHAQNKKDHPKLSPELLLNQIGIWIDPTNKFMCALMDFAKLTEVPSDRFRMDGDKEREDRSFFEGEQDFACFSPTKKTMDMATHILTTAQNPIKFGQLRLGIGKAIPDLPPTHNVRQLAKSVRGAPAL